MDIKKSYFNVAKPALKYKWVYVVLLLCGVILIITDLAFAQTSRKLFDMAPNIPNDEAVKIILSFILITIFQFIIRFVNSYTESYLNESIVYEMRRQTLNKIQHLPIHFFDLNHSSNVMSIFFNQLESVKHFIVYEIRNILQLPLTFILVGAYLFTVHPILALIALVASMLQLVSNTVYKKSLGDAIDGQQKVTNDVFHTMGEAMNGIREVKINQLENLIDSRMKSCQQRGVRYNLLLTKYRMYRLIIKEIPMKIGHIFGLAFGIFLMLRGQINPGDLVAFITLLGKMSEPFNGMVNAYINFQESSRHAQEMLILMQETEENYDKGEDLSNTIESIEFNNVTFRYSAKSDDAVSHKNLELLNKSIETNNIISDSAGDARNILEDISFKIYGGKTVALVGPSGSGKSTIIRLLYRFYDLQKGLITLNGKNLDSYNILSLRKNMSIVSQDVFIFDGTVYDNLVLGRNDISDIEIENALRFSQSYDFVYKLSEGLHTKLGERGVKLSQGQKQRISIARAIIKNAKIIILDEPTSALDVDTELSFQKDFEEWAKNCTKIIIAHRLTTIRDADYVLFLDDGKIIEQGSPLELLRQGGRFKEYWDKQFIFQEEAEDIN